MCHSPHPTIACHEHLWSQARLAGASPDLPDEDDCGSARLVEVVRHQGYLGFPHHPTHIVSNTSKQSHSQVDLGDLLRLCAEIARGDELVNWGRVFDLADAGSKLSDIGGARITQS